MSLLVPVPWHHSDAYLGRQTTLGNVERVISTCADEGRGSPASPPPPLLGQGSALSHSGADSQGQPSLGLILSAQELLMTEKKAVEEELRWGLGEWSWTLTLHLS